ncbi:hypothetical protein [Desertivirga arenae]|nr:hypothetical protein [Pedobacter sp. SYSU D00823]
MNTVNVIITVTLLVLAVILNQAFEDKESGRDTSNPVEAVVKSTLVAK